MDKRSHRIGYGCDLYECNKNIDDGATIFDWCIESNDDKMLSFIFTFFWKCRWTTEFHTD